MEVILTLDNQAHIDLIVGTATGKIVSTCGHDTGRAVEIHLR